MSNPSNQPDCVRGGNLGIDCALGSLVREFELFTMRLRVLLECFEKLQLGYTKAKFRNSYEMATAGMMRTNIVQSFQRASPKDTLGLAELQEADSCWMTLIEARNLVIHTIPVMFDEGQNLWWFEKKFRIPQTNAFRSRTEELQPEHIYRFGQEIYRFTLELVTASHLFTQDQSIAEAFQLGKKYGATYDPFNDFTLGPIP